MIIAIIPPKQMTECKKEGCLFFLNLIFPIPQTLIELSSFNLILYYKNKTVIG